MSATVFCIILFAAVLHAVWNAIVKGADDKLMTTIMVAGSGAAISAVIVPFLSQPAPASWPFLLISMVLQTVYYFLVAGAYRAADMSQAYPLMRGAAPLLVAAASALWLRDQLSPLAWSGIALLSCGVVSMALVVPGRGTGKGIAIALTNAVFIAAYTVSDGLGVRHSGSPAAYTMWLFLLTSIPLVGWAVATRGRVFGHYVIRHLPLGLVGGICTLASYGLALWAMTTAPVAMVAALRETSILFAAVIAALVLKERLSPGRIAAICLIAGGAALLRLA